MHHIALSNSQRNPSHRLQHLILFAHQQLIREPGLVFNSASVEAGDRDPYAGCSGGKAGQPRSAYDPVEAGVLCIMEYISKYTLIHIYILDLNDELNTRG